MFSSLLFPKEDKATASGETFLEIEEAETLLEEHFAIWQVWGLCYDQCFLENAWIRVKGRMIWSAAPHVVSVSTSCSRCCYLALFLWSLHVLILMYVSYASPPVRKTTSPQWCHLWTLQACLPRRLPFSQHVSWQCCNPPGILSSTAEILLFNSVFHDGVDLVSVSTLKLPLGVIGVVTLKPRASPILPLCI